jgi:hypothetical protein
MNPGIGKGFVKFGTMAHRVLTLIHASGRATLPGLHQDIVDLQGDDPSLYREVGTTLDRLHHYGLIHRVGRQRSAAGQLAYVYALEKGGRGADWEQARSSSERCRRYREKARVRVSSVFEFRGQITVDSGM